MRNPTVRIIPFFHKIGFPTAANEKNNLEREKNITGLWENSSSSRRMGFPSFSPKGASRQDLLRQRPLNGQHDTLFLILRSNEMQTTSFFFRVGSRFAAMMLLAALLVSTGCFDKKPTPPPADSSSPGSATGKGATTVAPNVKKMEPQAAPKTEEAPKAEEKKADAPKEGAFQLKTSNPYGKIAAEAVPMAPVADLVAQADDYLEKLGGTLKDLDGTSDYKKDADAVVRDANGLALVALALGMSAEENKYKKAAPGIITAAAALGKVEKLDAAQKAYADLKAAFESTGDPASLGWTKVASLGPVMKAVPNLDSTIKRLSNTEKKLKKNADRVNAALAGVAAIAQGSMANAAETNKPAAEAEWKKECIAFRDAAIAANAAVHGCVDGKNDYAAFEAAYLALDATCKSCHVIFNPDQK